MAWPPHQNASGIHPKYGHLWSAEARTPVSWWTKKEPQRPAEDLSFTVQRHPITLETAAADRSSWRQLLHKGVKMAEEKKERKVPGREAQESQLSGFG